MSDIHSSSIDPKSVEGFPITNPHAKIVKDRGHQRVVERFYYWDQEKRRGLEKRKYIGYVVDGRYYSNDDYKKLYKRSGKKRIVAHVSNDNDAVKQEQVPALETRIAGELPLYYAIAQEQGLIDDLRTVWGEHYTKIILSIAFHWLQTEHNAAYLYESWSQDHFLPYTENLSSKDLSAFFKEITLVPGWRKNFFKARIARLPENEVLSFDATTIASESKEITDVCFGKGKEGYCQNQIGLIILLGHKSKTPVLFRMLPGNISDVTTVPDMLFRFDEISEKKRVFAAVLDRGFCSLDNIARFIDQKSRIIMATKLNAEWVTQAIDEALPVLSKVTNRIRGKNCWGYSVPVTKKFPDGKERTFWLQVYRSYTKLNYETEAFFKTIEDFEDRWNSYHSSSDKSTNYTVALRKSPLLKYFVKPGLPGKDLLVRNQSALEEATRYFGCFCNVTTFECSPTDALIEYSERDCIEKSFKFTKSYAELDTLRAHGNETAEGRLIIGFCCMTILNKLYQLMGQSIQITPNKQLPPLIKEMTFNEIKNYLSPIRLVFDGKGNKRWCEITKKQHMIAQRLGYPDLYKILPQWEIN